MKIMEEEIQAPIKEEEKLEEKEELQKVKNKTNSISIVKPILYFALSITNKLTSRRIILYYNSK